MRHAHAALWTLLLVAGCRATDPAGESPPVDRAKPKSGEERALAPSEAGHGSEREVVSELVACEQRLGELRVALEANDAELLRVQVTQGDADTQRQLAAAMLAQRGLSGELAIAVRALEEAHLHLSQDDLDGVNARLTTLRAALERLKNAEADLPGLLSVRLEVRLFGEPLELDTPYATELGMLSVRALRYWLSGVTLVRNDGTQVALPSTYSLMQVSGAQTLRGGTQRQIALPAKRREIIELVNVPAGEYKAIGFDVGVDAEHNDDLSLSGGELGVLTNMAALEWMWFTSYIFTQIEGRIAPPARGRSEGAATLPHTDLVWENGSNADLRRVVLQLAAPVRVSLAAHPRIELVLDVERVWKGLSKHVEAARKNSEAHPVSSISAADTDARAVLADNWRDAFRAAEAVDAP